MRSATAVASTMWRSIRRRRSRSSSATGGLAALVFVCGLVTLCGIADTALVILPAAAAFVGIPWLLCALTRLDAMAPTIRPSTRIGLHAAFVHLPRVVVVCWLLHSLPTMVPSRSTLALLVVSAAIAFELPRHALPTLARRRKTSIGKRVDRADALLVDQSNTLGDLVLSTSFLDGLRDRGGTAGRVTVLCRDEFRSIVESHPGVSEVIADPLGGTDQGGAAPRVFGPLRRMKSVLRAVRPDSVVQLWNRPTSAFALAARLVGVPVLAGPLDRERYGWMFDVGTFESSDQTRHQVERYLDLLASLDGSVSVPAAGPLRLRLSGQAIEQAHRLFARHGVTSEQVLVALSPGTGGSNRALTSARYAAIVRALCDRGARVVLLGSPSERTFIADIRSQSPPSTFDMGEEANVGLLAAVLSLCRAHVGIDSGPGHIAAALGVPCVVIWPAKGSRAVRWAPWMTRQVIVRPPIRCPLVCHPWACRSTCCIDGISADSVCVAYDELMAGGGSCEPAQGRRMWAAASFGVIVHSTTPSGGSGEEALGALRDFEHAGFANLALSCPPSHPAVTRARAEGFDVRGADARALMDLLVEFDGGVLYDWDERATTAWRTAVRCVRGWTRHEAVRVTAATTARDERERVDELVAAVAGSRV
jgi:ADP-heptose:LPS heptosyltransferase